MMIDVNVTLNEGVDARQFADSFSSDNVMIYSLSKVHSNRLFVAVEKSFLETFLEDSRISDAQLPAPAFALCQSSSMNLISPPLPSKQTQTGRVLVGETAKLDDHNNNLDRPFYGSDASLAQQEQFIALSGAKWLGSQHASFHVMHDSDAAGPNRYEDFSASNPSQRTTVGNHPDDFSSKGWNIADFNANNTLTGTETKYESRFFGEHVDIVAYEPSLNRVIAGFGFDITDEHFDYVYHPDFGKGPDTGDVVGINGSLGNMGDAPTGTYAHTDTRIKLSDWNGDPSTGTDLGTRRSLLSRYNNTNLTKAQRAPMNNHCMATLSAAGGLVGGHAKKANLYPHYFDVGFNDVKISDLDSDNTIRALFNTFILGMNPVDALLKEVKLNVAEALLESYLSAFSTLADFHINKPRNPEVKYYREEDQRTVSRFTAANETAHLALTIPASIRGGSNYSRIGAVVVRTDQNKTYVYNGGTANSMADYTEIDSSLVANNSGSTATVNLGQVIGVPNPTVIIQAWGSTDDMRWFYPIDNINKLKHKGFVLNRPAQGWGNNLEPFIERGYIPLRMEDPENPGQYMWVVGVSSAAVPINRLDDTLIDLAKLGTWVMGGDDSKVNEENAADAQSFIRGRGQIRVAQQTSEALWEAGMVVVTSAGNNCQSFARYDDGEYRSSCFSFDGNTKVYQAMDKNVSDEPIVQMTEATKLTHFEIWQPIPGQSRYGDVYPFRLNGHAACKRDKNIVVAAVQSSETHPILEGYSNRGPGIDICARGTGTFAAHDGAKNAFGYIEFPADTTLGNGTYLDPNETEFISGTDWTGIQFRPIYDSSNPYPFEAGQTLRINSLGHSSKGRQARQNVPANQVGAPLGGFIFTGSNVASNQITISAHGLVDGDKVTYKQVTGTNGSTNTITGLTNNTLFHVKKVDNNTIKLSTNTDLSSTQTLTVVSGGVDAAGAMKFTLEHEQAQDAWNTYLGTSGATYAVNDTFTLPSSNVNVPNLAQVATKGWKWGYYSGTSAAAPIVAGKVACMMEEYLHVNGRWPTNNEAKQMLLAQAKRVDMEAPSTHWHDTPTPSRSSSSLDKHIISPRDKSHTNMLLSQGIANPDFTTRSGELQPDMTGWTPVNRPTTAINVNASGGTVSAGAVSTLPITKIRAATNHTHINFAVNHGIKEGSVVTISGCNLSGASTLNSTVFYVKAYHPTVLELYTNSALTTKFVSGITAGNYSTGTLGTATMKALSTVVAPGQFRDSSNNLLKINIGDKIVATGTPSGTTNGTYSVVASTNYNTSSNATLTLKNDANVTTVLSSDLSSTVLSVIQHDANTQQGEDNRYSVKLTNTSGQAGISTKVPLRKNRTYSLILESASKVNMKVQFPGSASHVVNSCTEIFSGTVTTGDARAYIMMLTAGSSTLTLDSEFLSHGFDTYDLVGDTFFSTNLNFSYEDGLPGDNSGEPPTKVFGFRHNTDSGVPDTGVSEPNTRPFLMFEETTFDGNHFRNAVGGELQDAERSVDTHGAGTNIALGLGTRTCGWSWHKTDGTRDRNEVTLLPDNEFMGSLSSTTFNDASGIQRTIKDMWWFEGRLDRANSGIFCFSLDGVDVPNTDATFGSINLGGMSFERSRAFFKPDGTDASTATNGKSVWWWHINSVPHRLGPDLPIIPSDLETIGTGSVPFTIINGSKNDIRFKPTHVGNAYQDYDLTLSNVATSNTGAATLIDNVKLIEHPIRLNSREENYLALYDDMNIHKGFTATDLVGTPPIIANYKGDGLNLTNKLQSSGKTLTSGAIFPTPVASLQASDTTSKLSADAGLTKDGWQRSKGRTSEGRVLTEVVENPNYPSGYKLADTGMNRNGITITSGAVAVPVASGLPGASFTVGNPVTATVVAQVVAAGTVFFNWQRTRDGINFEDIDSNDAIYTNAHTAQMTVTGYEHAEIVGDQYRCRLSEANSEDVFTNIVTVIEA